jgi:hypothetical protein
MHDRSVIEGNYLRNVPEQAHALARREPWRFQRALQVASAA